MSKRYRIFRAPESDEDCLPIDPSFWHDGREVCIPLDHWQMISEFASEVLPDQVEKLIDQSCGSYDYYLSLTKEEHPSLIDMLKTLMKKLEEAPSILYLRDRVGDFSDEYKNSDHVKMIEAVIAVFMKGKRLNKPIIE
jgi:hypothetical protein